MLKVFNRKINAVLDDTIVKLGELKIIDHMKVSDWNFNENVFARQEGKSVYFGCKLNGFIVKNVV